MFLKKNFLFIGKLNPRKPTYDGIFGFTFKMIHRNFLLVKNKSTLKSIPLQCIDNFSPMFPFHIKSNQPQQPNDAAKITIRLSADRSL